MLYLSFFLYMWEKNIFNDYLIDCIIKKLSNGCREMGENNIEWIMYR